MAIDQSAHDEIVSRAPQNLILIDGKGVSSTSGGVFEHINPSTGCVQASIPLCGADDVDRAVTAARKGLARWRQIAPSRRAELLSRLQALVDSDIENMALLSAIENAIPVTVTKNAYFPRAAAWMRYYAGFADKVEGAVTATWPAEQLEYTIPEPFGVIGCIITWNAPVISLAFKVFPALAAGCSVVIKPSEMTPFVAARFVELAHEAGIPDGVINLIPGGPEAGEALCRHPGVDKISFTGGLGTARRILMACAETIKPSLHELGGKSANIIFEDADLAFASYYSATFAMYGSGQACQSPSRLLVHDSIYDEFVPQVLNFVQSFSVGDPLDEDTFMGPVVNRAAVERIEQVIEGAKRDGSGALLTGGESYGGRFGRGHFVMPTVFGDVDPKSDLAQNEIFGPVLSVIRFKSDAEALQIANGTKWGLAGYVQTKSLSRAHRFAADLICGSVHINGSPNVHAGSPFGGVGLSGFGKEGGRWGLEEFIRQKNVGVIV
jgi:aldehyde dehydrogenase (NAD+)